MAKNSPATTLNPDENRIKIVHRIHDAYFKCKYSSGSMWVFVKMVCNFKCKSDDLF